MSALALDRQAIEKKDFPISRRGYDPDAVDAHLAGLAGELERLQGDLDRAERAAATAGAPARAAGPQSLAMAASQQVQMIVEAAESSAADIERAAQEQAARIRSDADAEARRVREEAIERSQDHVGSVGEATATMLQRVDAMEGELGALLESLRTGTNRLGADLSLLHGNLGELYGAAGSSRPVAAPALPAAPAAAEPEPEPVAVEPEPEPVAVEPEPVAVEPEPEPVAVEPEPVAVEPEPEPVAVEPEPAPRAPRADGDVEGARLIALNMALNGQSREETDRYLSDNFDLEDRPGLLDEVYATVEG